MLTLQKSMDLTPLEPRAGPTGGEGDAWPAPTMSFTIWSFWMALRAMMSAMAGREYSRRPHISSQTSSEHLLVRQLNLIWQPSFWARLHRVSAVSLSRSGDQSWRAKALPPRRLARAEECNGFRTCIIILCRSQHRLSSHASHHAVRRAASGRSGQRRNTSWHCLRACVSAARRSWQTAPAHAGDSSNAHKRNWRFLVMPAPIL